MVEVEHRSLCLYTQAQDVEQACAYQRDLQARGVNIELQQVEQLKARFFRLHTDLAMCVDAQGLWLSAEGMKMQPDWLAEIPRLKRASLKSEMIARACQLSEKPTLLDATAGLGHDSLLMAHLGAKVTLVERHPILFSLLEDAKRQATAHTYLAETMHRIELVHADSADYLKQCAQEQKDFDVVYLDPMFPQRDQHSQKKQAQVKKQMQLLHHLLPEDGEMDLGDYLLQAAQHVATRVIVKRPKLAVYLADMKPDHQWLGDACRFDAYFKV